MFELGKVVITATVYEFTKRIFFHTFVIKCVRLHHSGDFGDCDEEGTEKNEEAVEDGNRIFSVYNIPTKFNFVGEVKIWIITEADRSSTCVMFPSDY
jgi:hypothetical protein